MEHKRLLECVSSPCRTGDHRPGMAAVLAEQLADQLVEALDRRTELYLINRAENPHRPAQFLASQVN